MEKVMDISCVMSVYDESKEMVKRAIESMLNQTYPLKEYIIVVDKPENQEIVEFVKQYEANTTVKVRVLVNEVNRGLAYSLNRGIAEATSELICRMDADDESLPNRLQESVAFMIEQGLDLVSTAVITVDEDGNLADKQREFPCGERAIKVISKYAACILHPTWLFKKTVWEDVNGYREIFVAAQDYDFTIRVLSQGYRIASLKSPQLKYTAREKSISGKNTAKQVFLAMYSQNNVYRKHKYDENLLELINNHKYKEYDQFKLYFDEFYKQHTSFKKVGSIIKGMLGSAYFRRYFYNAVMLKLLKKYYFFKER